MISSITVIPKLQISALKSYPLTCSITSGAIQHGVPTKVCLDLSLDKSPNVAIDELTPKSEIQILIANLQFVTDISILAISIPTISIPTISIPSISIPIISILAI